MPSARRNTIPVEALLTLRRRLDELSPRHPDRQALIADVTSLYDVSLATVYRALRDFHQPRAAGRAWCRRQRWNPTANSSPP